ncbi:MAG: SDR family oxidoreductase [Saprospiraceae bacterium]|nr:SDR family oxidoreductase [Saprospiraceae bacterium]MBK7812434.1 SDR family oxidoreductase [Saprospiraceae bacterium]MBK9632341.1 SDR family oxidoreductase [Saprospiraceae bacterium]
MVQNRKYLIIGASSGIGLAISKKLSETGAQVVGTYFKNKIGNTGIDSEYQYFDVMGKELDPKTFPEVLDGLVYCPGTISLLPFNRINPQKFLEDYQFQFLGLVRSVQMALPFLKKSTQASVIFFSTVAVQIGLPFHSLVASSKGAIEGLTRSLAAEFAPQIRFNCIAPALVETPLAASLLNTEEKKLNLAQKNPLKRLGQPEDIAEMACFLLSDKSSWMTGQIIHLDGGFGSIK